MIDMKHVTQEERLDYLVEAFKADSGKYKDIETPKDIEGNQIIAFEAIEIRIRYGIISAKQSPLWYHVTSRGDCFCTTKIEGKSK